MQGFTVKYENETVARALITMFIGLGCTIEEDSINDFCEDRDVAGRTHLWVDKDLELATDYDPLEEETITIEEAIKRLSEHSCIKIKLSDNFTCVVEPDEVTVGCQTYTHEEVKELVSLVADRPEVVTRQFGSSRLSFEIDYRTKVVRIPAEEVTLSFEIIKRIGDSAAEMKG